MRRETSKDDTAKPQAAAVHRHEFTVPETAIDGNGHVNNVAYVQWMQDIAIEHFAATGGVDLMHDLGGTWVARSHHIEYLRPAFAGDRVEAATWVANLRRVRSLRRYAFTRTSDGKVLARGETDWVFVNVESGRPSSIPEAIKHLFTLVPDGPES
ncbi:acyl-CoA thioesterase [Candidatus Bipolaricaulota bacterium]